MEGHDRADELSRWFFPPLDDADTPSGFDFYGTQAAIEVLDADPMQQFRYSETGGPVPSSTTMRK